MDTVDYEVVVPIHGQPGRGQFVVLNHIRSRSATSSQETGTQQVAYFARSISNEFYDVRVWMRPTALMKFSYKATLASLVVMDPVWMLATRAP